MRGYKKEWFADAFERYLPPQEGVTFDDESAGISNSKDNSGLENNVTLLRQEPKCYGNEKEPRNTVFVNDNSGLENNVTAKGQNPEEGGGGERDTLDSKGLSEDIPFNEDPPF